MMNIVAVITMDDVKGSFWGSDFAENLGILVVMSKRINFEL
jgi:hypothetical protein